MIEALIIDVDGVVVRGRPGDNRAWHTDLLADLGVNYADLKKRFFTPYWREITLGRIDLRDSLTPVLAVLAPKVPVGDFITYWFTHDAAVDGDILRAVERARRSGMRAILATNQEHERSRYLWKDLGLYAHFDGMIYSAAIGSRKPEAEFYRAAASWTELPPEAHFLIDDTEANVVAARAEGWQAAVWNRHSELGQLLAVSRAACSRS